LRLIGTGEDPLHVETRKVITEASSGIALGGDKSLLFRSAPKNRIEGRGKREKKEKFRSLMQTMRDNRKNRIDNASERGSSTCPSKEKKEETATSLKNLSAAPLQCSRKQLGVKEGKESPVSRKRRGKKPDSFRIRRNTPGEKIQGF